MSSPDHDARETLAPDAPSIPAPFDPSARVTRVQARTLTPGASLAARPSERVQLVDKLSEIIGILAITALAWVGKIDGTLAAGLILAILGVNTGLRQIGARAMGSSAAAGLGIVGLLATHGAEILHHVARARGLATLALTMLGMGLAGCPNWQRPACPAPGAYTCVRDQPHYCAPSKELTPMGDEPCSMQGRACAIDTDGVAWCAPVVTADAGVR